MELAVRIPKLRMQDITGTVLLVIAMATISNSMSNMGMYQGSRCRSAGQYLLHPGSRCQYIHCSYRHTPYRSALVGMARQCPLGTRVPRSVYTQRATRLFYHPMALCAERVNVFNPSMQRQDCSVPAKRYRQISNYDDGYDHTYMAFRRPRKMFRGMPVSTRFYKATNAIDRTTAYEQRELPEPNDVPVMLNDLPDFPFSNSINSKMAALTEPDQQNEVEAPSSRYEGVNDYQMDPEEEADILREMKTLIAVEEPEIMSDDESNKLLQGMMDDIFNS